MPSPNVTPVILPLWRMAWAGHARAELGINHVRDRVSVASGCAALAAEVELSWAVVSEIESSRSWHQRGRGCRWLVSHKMNGVEF